MTGTSIRRAFGWRLTWCGLTGDAAIAQHLLGRTVVVDDPGDAAATCIDGAARVSVCDAGGRSAGGGWHASAGPLTAAMGLLSRRSELEAIDAADCGSGWAHRAAWRSSLPRETRRRRRWKKNRIAAQCGVSGQHGKVELTSGLRRTTTSRMRCSASSRCWIASLQNLLEQKREAEDGRDSAGGAAQRDGSGSGRRGSSRLMELTARAGMSCRRICSSWAKS